MNDIGVKWRLFGNGNQRRRVVRGEGDGEVNMIKVFHIRV
jgi:hypothetical protein